MCTYEFTYFCAIGKTGVERERKKKSSRTLKLSKLLRVLSGYKKPDNVRKTGVCWESHKIDLFLRKYSVVKEATSISKECTGKSFVTPKRKDCYGIINECECPYRIRAIEII